MDYVVTESDFDMFCKLIYKESGISFSEINRSILEGRLKDGARSKKLDSVREYYTLVTSSSDELKEMLDSVTTNLTRFFRNQPHFDTLINYVIPRLVEKKRKKNQKEVRIWSAGCSTGEEPYTLAMVLKEKLPADINFSILASDISLKSILTAKQGFYPTHRCQGIPPEYLNKYFTENETGYQVKDSLKEVIRFDYHNLKHNAEIASNDIVFCRNVLIYFDEAAQLATVNNFYKSMDEDSFLFIGHSESLFGMDTKFEFLRTDWACIYHKS